MNIPADHALVPVDPPSPKEHKINWVAFASSFILAPLVPVLLTAPFYFISDAVAIFAVAMAAVAFGCIPYALLGIPIGIITIQSRGCDGPTLVARSFGATIGLIVFFLIIGVVLEGPDGAAILFLAPFALFFAPLWTAIFAGLYNRFEWGARHV